MRRSNDGESALRTEQGIISHQKIQARFASLLGMCFKKMRARAT